MGKRSRQNKGCMQAWGRRQERELREQVALARQMWLGKRVVLEVEQYRSWPGRVSEITEEGLVCIEDIPGTAGVMLTLGYLYLLTLVE